MNVISEICMYVCMYVFLYLKMIFAIFPYLTIKNSLKNVKNDFYFILKPSFCSRNTQIFIFFPLFLPLPAMAGGVA